MTVNKQTKAQVITTKLSKHVDVTQKYTYSGRNIHLSECSVRSPRFLKFKCTHLKKKFYATKTNRDVIAHVTDMSEEKKNTCITGGYELKMILFVLDCDFGLRYLDHNLGVSKRHQSGTPNTVVNTTASLLYSKFRIQNITKTKIHRVDTIKILRLY